MHAALTCNHENISRTKDVSWLQIATVKDHSHDNKYHQKTLLHCFGDLSPKIRPYLLFFMFSNALCDKRNSWIAVETSSILFPNFKSFNSILVAVSNVLVQSLANYILRTLIIFLVSKDKLSEPQKTFGWFVIREMASQHSYGTNQAEGNEEYDSYVVKSENSKIIWCFRKLCFQFRLLLTEISFFVSERMKLLLS